MQIYIIGMGQCGTSMAFDVIGELTGFIKSKEVTSLPQNGGDVQAASNELEERLSKGLTGRIWKARFGAWLSRLWDGQGPRKAFILPEIALIDGNPDNFVKTAFAKFRGKVVANRRCDRDLRQLVNLIQGTKLLGLGKWKSGCANGLVGEVVTATNLQPKNMRGTLCIDHQGKLTKSGLPVSVFLVVSSAGGATGSGGGVYLSQTDALLSPTAAQADPPSHAIVTNAVVLPSVQASTYNIKYALNAGRALARHANMITGRRADGEAHRPSAMILFSNPPNEGKDALQRLNNYIGEFAIRVANFSFSGNAPRVARDVDTAELRFLLEKTSVLAMSQLNEDDWYDEDLELKLVKRAFVNLYESDAKNPHGLSVERWPSSEEDEVGGLSTVTSALVVIGVPPTPKSKPDLSFDESKISECLKEHTGSSLDAGIVTCAYDARENLELTVFLRYRTMSKCPLAMHFATQYIGTQWNSDAESVPETDHIADRATRNDRYAEVFEGLARDISALSGTMDFSGFLVHRPADLT